jgi:succinate dehydrogenase/fumarate reductase-like Fe-S protein
MSDQISVSVRRYDPEQPGSARLETYRLPKEVCDGMTVVTALNYIQETIDPTLAFYYSCELGRCRGCLMDVNGKATFACTAPIVDGAVIEPLAHLPVIRDLVVKFLIAEPRVDSNACSGCGSCVDACPMDVYELSEADGLAVVRDGTKAGFMNKGDAVDCMGCRRCEKDCPSGAIEVTELGGQPRRPRPAE